MTKERKYTGQKEKKKELATIAAIKKFLFSFLMHLIFLLKDQVNFLY